jgi:soluble lytic murein transglycosylase
MHGKTYLLGFTILLSLGALAACQRNAPPKPTPTPTGIYVAQAATRPPSPTPSSTSSPSPTPAATATPSPTATASPTPTPTPVPSARLAAAQQAFAWGDYERAHQEYAALLADPGAGEREAQAAAYWVGRSALEDGDFPTALAAFQDYVQDRPQDLQAGSIQLMMARAYEGLEDWQGAIAAYQAYLDSGEKTLDIYAYEGVGDAAMLALDYQGAAKAYAQGLGVAPDNGWVVHMREGIAQSELAQGNPEAAIEQYDAILSVARIRAYRARILRMAGQASMMADDSEAAYERYAQTVERYSEAYDAYLALVELVNAKVPVDDYQRGLVDYYARAYQPAIEALTRHIEANPDAHKGDAHWYLALSLKANGNLWQAIQEFKELIETHPQNENATQAWLEMAEAQVWRDEVDQALQTYRLFADEQPQSPLAVTALWKAAQLETGSGDLENSANSFRDLATRYPETEEAPEALFKAALLDYQRAEFEAARDNWQALVRDYPDSEAAVAARFWLGKSWLALESREQANNAFEASHKWAPTSYYGLRASEILEESSGFSMAAAPLVPSDPDGDRAAAESWLATWLPITPTLELRTLDPDIEESPAFRRGDALLAAGRRTDALDEFDAVKESWWEDPLAMYQLALAFRERGLYRLSIICAERLTWLSPVGSRAEVPVFVQRLSFPVYFRELIVSETLSQSVDPLLFFALIRQESLFEPSVSSPADARGLTQVIPATGDWVAGRLGWGELEENDLFRPYVNVLFGSWYLSVQLAAFQEEIAPALAAYNAGPGHVQKWIEETPDIDLFVETIPFAESRRYVHNVYENYAHYLRLYQVQP